jgi:hypothetical protein
MKVTKAQIIQTLFVMRGSPVRFDKHPYQVDMLNTDRHRVIFKCSRQVGKSSLLCLTIGGTVALPNGKVIDPRMTYVSPSWDQTKTFVVEKLRPIFRDDSPRFKELFIDNKCTDEIRTQTFSNGVQLFLRAAHWNADRVRGIPSDIMFVDELQSMLKSNVPVIESSLSASKINRMTLCGTPLSLENGMEDYWRRSTQSEWVIPCDHHTPRVWNIPSVDNIGTEGLICKKCGHRINPMDGRWVDMTADASYKGFHISQLLTDINLDPDLWNLNVVQPYEDWEESKFMNEVMGMSFGAAGRPVSIEMLQKCCAPQSATRIWDSKVWHTKPPTKPGVVKWFAGVDWGEGREEASVEGTKKNYASFTHFIIGAFDDNNVFRLAHWKKFQGQEISPSECVNYILAKCKEWGVESIGVDWGHGWGVNEQLVKGLLGTKTNLLQFVHNAALKELFRWHRAAQRVTLNRNAMMSKHILAITEGTIGFPTWEAFAPLSKDFLAIYKEFNNHTGLMQYDHSMSEPDDGFHASLYARVVAQLKLGMISPH